MQTYNLPFNQGSFELTIGIIIRSIFQKIFNFLSFFSNLHHPDIRYFLFRLFCAPFQIFSQTNQSRMERQSKQHLRFKLIINLLDHKTMLGNVISEL